MEEKIRKKIEDYCSKNYLDTFEKKLVEHGYSLAQETIEELKKVNIALATESQERFLELESLRGRVEELENENHDMRAGYITNEIRDKFKELEALRDRLKSIEPELHTLRSYQGMTVTEQNKMIEELESLRKENQELKRIVKILYERH